MVSFLKLEFVGSKFTEKSRIAARRPRFFDFIRLLYQYCEKMDHRCAIRLWPIPYVSSRPSSPCS